MAKKDNGKQQRDPNEVERRVVFYRIHYKNGRKFPAEKVADKLKTLSREELQLDYGEDTLTVWIRSSKRPVQMIFAKIRSNALPQINGKSGLRDMEIAEDEGLAELVQVMFFPPHFVGVLQNFHGPHFSSIGKYLGAKMQKLGWGDDFHPPTLEPLIRGDVIDSLKRFNSLTLIELEARPSYIAEGDDSGTEHAVGTHLSDLQRDIGSESITVVMKMEKGSRKPLPQRAWEFVMGLAGRKDIQEGANKFKVRGFDTALGRMAELDLLKDRFVAPVRVVRQNPRTRALVELVAFDAINNAYDDLRDDLEKAAPLHETHDGEADGEE